MTQDSICATDLCIDDLKLEVPYYFPSSLKKWQLRSKVTSRHRAEAQRLLNYDLSVLKALTNMDYLSVEIATGMYSIYIKKKNSIYLQIRCFLQRNPLSISCLENCLPDLMQEEGLPCLHMNKQAHVETRGREGPALSFYPSRGENALCS